MSSGFRHWCAWFAAEALGLLALVLIPMPWLMFVIVAIALLWPFALLAIWHWSTPEQQQRLYNSEGTNLQNQKGPLKKNEGKRDQYPSGEVDETMLEALPDYVKRQKKRLGIAEKKEAVN